MDHLLWSLLGCVMFPVWLAAGLLDYWLHQRTRIAATAGLPESRLHLAQTAQVGVPVLIVLFLELNGLALLLVVAGAAAHTVTAYWDIRYASRHREILPLEQMTHAFLIALPVFATALLLVLHWSGSSAPDAPSVIDGTAWELRPRRHPWDVGVVHAVLLASFLFGLLPGLAEWWQARKAATM
ncbi:MAG: diguanylate cyclase [Steroidobacteraceae bacterium]